MKTRFQFTRRNFILAAGLGVLTAPQATAAAYRELSWDDLIPPGVPFGEIIGQGDLDEQSDMWNPIFDENASKLNMSLDGQPVKLPGFVIPLDIGSDGVKSFVLVPYVGACIHVPPPPPNQIVFVTTKTPWQSEDMWDAIWVYGRMNAKLQETEVAQAGYQITAEKIEYYE